MENYSFYLFAKLFDEYIGHQYEYDLMFQDINNLFTLYSLSEYNNSNQPEYECMVEFFLDNVDYIRNQEYLTDIDNLK